MFGKSTETFGHALRGDRKKLGATYTPLDLASAVAGNILAGHAFQEFSRVRILDPGCGDGALTAAILRELPQGVRALCDVLCIDMDADSLEAARSRLTEEFPDVVIEYREADFIQFASDAALDGRKFDFVIANPPYVRIQTLDVAMRKKIKDIYGLTGRTDLAFAFIVAILRLLSDGGRAAVITSNKLLSTDAGKPVREALLYSANVTEVWDLGDTRLFEAAVLPTVLFFGTGGEAGGEASFTSIYQDEGADTTGVEVCDDFCKDLNRNLTKIDRSGRVFRQRRGRLVTDGTWRIGLDHDLEWLARIKEGTWKSFGDVSKISVGIKSTADKVFIAKDWQKPRPELLRPLVTHHVAGRYRPTRSADREVLYPHEMRGNKKVAVDIDAFPVSKAYLETHRERLEGRSYVAEAGREWFELWVPHSPDDWDQRKIVFRDISEKSTFWIESEGSVINGDCYWIRLDDDADPDLIWLMLAVGNSSFIEKFYDVKFNERLYAGRRRFMTRHVKQFPVPDPSHPSSVIAAVTAKRLATEDLEDVLRVRLEELVDQHIDQAFSD